MGLPSWLKKGAGFTPLGAAIGLLDGQRAIKNLTSTDPFKQRKSPLSPFGGAIKKYKPLIGGKKKKPSSQSSARTMRGYGTKKRSLKRPRTAKKAKYSRKKRRGAMPKKVALTIGTVRERLVNHDTRSMSDCNYASFSSVGRQTDMIRYVAQATLLHYMHRVGDFRSNRSVGVAGDELADAPASDASKDTLQFATWKVMKFTFLQHARHVGTDAESVEIAEGTLDAMTTSLAAWLLGQFRDGRRLAQVAVFREPDNCVLCDINAGRNHIEFSSSAHLKIQNVTVADGAGGEDKLSINANPIDGLAYKFKNAVPLFKQGYMLGKTDAHRVALDELSDLDSGSSGGHQVVDLASIANEYNIPPINPSTIFRNVSGKSKVSLAPGAMQMFTQFEHYKGPINSFADRYFAHNNSFPSVPPGGSCMLIGLKPSLRNATSGQTVKLEKEYNYMYCARMTKSQITALPMRTIIN